MHRNTDEVKILTCLIMGHIVFFPKLTDDHELEVVTKGMRLFLFAGLETPQCFPE